jgi:hypothetical protein
MSEVVAIEFTSPSGEALRFEWPVEALRALGGADEEPTWSLGGELDWDELKRVRVLSGRLGDGLAVAAAELLPRGAEGHGEGPIAGILLADGESEELTEILLSTEYGPESAPRRLGLELYRAGAEIPLRIAGDAKGGESTESGGVRNDRVIFELRWGSVDGVGVLETMEQG